MIDKPDDKANDKRTDKAPEKAPEKTEGQRRADIAAEYETLLTQDQDEHSIVKALCAKYSLDQPTLGEIMAEARKGPAKGPHTPGSEPPKPPSNPAREDQMGQAPARGTVQSGKEPKTD